MANGNGIYHNVDSVWFKKIIENHASVITVADKEDRAMPNPHADDGMVEHLFVFSVQSMNSLQAYLSSFVGYWEEKPK